MTKKRSSWKTVIEKRRQINFVGRSEFLRQFSDNFATDEPTYLLFFVTGEGGVGKSTLLKQFATIKTGRDNKAIEIICNDEHLSPVAAMGYISEQLAKLEIRAKEFDERYKTYRARRDEIESDPKAPRGALDLVVRGMTAFAIKAARRTPGVGVFADYVDEKDATEALSQGVSYLIDRIGNKDEVELLRKPERILTPLFIKLLNKACEEHRLILMFDVFERTSEALEPWLMEFLNFDYGEFETNLTFITSGRDAPDQRWTQIASSICHITLEPFTPEETRLYLSHRDITDEQLVKQIHEDTGGLPVLIELLAGTKPTPGLPLPDISHDAVKRFLQWIPDEEHKRIALLAAVPRQFNSDTLGAVFDCDGTTQFNWLSTQSYIRTSMSRGWFYHEKVRELMLRHLRNTLTGAMCTAHERLAQFYQTQQNKMNLVDKAAYSSVTWREYEVERCYHLLCAQPEGYLTQAIDAFLMAFRWRWSLGERIAQVCHQAGHEMFSSEVQEWASILSEFCQAYDKDEYEKFVVQANIIEKRSGLNPMAQASLRANRGAVYWLMDKLSAALIDFDRAIELDSRYHYAYEKRGFVLCEMERYDEAIESLTQGINIDPNCMNCVAQRGSTYYLMDNFTDALTDLNRAVTLDDKNKVAIASRGMTYKSMERFTEALADFDHAVKLDDTDDCIIANRGETYLKLGRFTDALADFDRAIELDSRYHYAYEKRGIVLRNMERYDAAIESLTLAIDTDPNCMSCVAQRGETYHAMGKFAEALIDFDRVAKLDDKNAWVIAQRGETYHAMGKFAEALIDFDRAISIDDKNDWIISQRGEIYRRVGDFEKSIADLNLAIERDSQDDSYPRSRRAAVYQALGRIGEADADIAHVMQSPQIEVHHFYNKAVICSLKGDYTEAVKLLREAITRDPLARIIAKKDDLLQPLRTLPEFIELMNVE